MDDITIDTGHATLDAGTTKTYGPNLPPPPTSKGSGAVAPHTRVYSLSLNTLYWCTVGRNVKTDPKVCRLLLK